MINIKQVPVGNNSFFLDDKFGFKSIKFYEEDDVEICKSGLNYYLKNLFQFLDLEYFDYLLRYYF